MTLSTSLFPIGGGDKAFETLTQDIKLDFNVGARDHIPIQVYLTLPDGRQLGPKELSGKWEQYALAARSGTETDWKSGSDARSKSLRSSKDPERKES